MDFEPENLKLMRTTSTSSMEGKDATQKWHGLFRMFKEWKHQNTVAQAAVLMKGTERAQVNDEIIKLRTAIYSLRQRKNLSATDQQLLQGMSEKLKEFTTKAIDLSKQEHKTKSELKNNK